MSEVAQLSEYRLKRKQLEVTAEMLEQIQYVADTDLSADDVVVFEATAINTLPLNKRGSIFENARTTRSTLTEMAAKLNEKENSVPLHTLHMQGIEIPLGRVFYGYVQDMPDGNAELRAQFYLPKSENEMIEKINLGIVDEVSVGLLSKQMLCSKCGWDYRGDDANFLHILDQTCENGHTIGEDGAHVVLQGCENWMETSLVSRGAASNAKIHGRAKELMPKEQQDRIAASGSSPEAVTLFASPTEPKPKEKETTMANEPKAGKNGNGTPAEAEFDAKAAHEELTGKFDTLVGKIDEFIEAQAPAKEEEEESEAVELNLAEDENFKELKASVDSISAAIEKIAGVKPADLAKDVPAGGVAASADSGTQTPSKGPDLSVFKSRK